MFLAAPGLSYNACTFFKDGDTWKEVKNKGDYTITKDEWDIIQFEPVNAAAVRLVINLPEEFATGIYEVIIE